MAAGKKHSYQPALRNWYQLGPHVTWQHQLQKTPDASGINISYYADIQSSTFSTCRRKRWRSCASHEGNASLAIDY